MGMFINHIIHKKFRIITLPNYHSQFPKIIRIYRQTRASVDEYQVLTDVRAIIAGQLGLEVNKVTSDKKFSDLGADSLDTVEIIMALEDKFDIQLDEEKAVKVTTVEEASSLIAKQLVI